MRKTIILIFLFPLLLWGQDIQQDSLSLIHAPWKTDTLEQGMILKTAQISNLFGAKQFISIIELPPSTPLKLQLCYESRLTRTSVQARKHHALAAVNGSFFDMGQDNPICFLRIDGNTVGWNLPGADTSRRKYYQTGTLVLLNGKPRIYRTNSSRHWEESLSYPDIMTAGPLLIYKGIRQPMRQDRTFVTDRHNRTAIGIKRDGTVCLFTVDGRSRMSAGMSLDELTSTLAWWGCIDALNFDGGGSTTLWIRDKIVNHPSDNGRFDHQGERKVSSCLLVVEQ